MKTRCCPAWRPTTDEKVSAVFNKLEEITGKALGSYRSTPEPLPGEAA